VSVFPDLESEYSTYMTPEYFRSRAKVLMRRWRACNSPTCTTCPISLDEQELAEALQEEFEAAVRSRKDGGVK